MADLATLQARLDEAEAAAHALAIGGKAQEVTTDSGTVKYTPANLAALQAYILSLKVQIGNLSNAPVRRTFKPGF